MTVEVELQLDPDLLNPNFNSWRLAATSAPSSSQGDDNGRVEAPTAGPVAEVRSSDLDYLHTRASVLRNHILQSAGRLFFATRSREGGAAYDLFELADDPSLPHPSLRMVHAAAVQADPSAVGPGSDRAVEAAVDCSVAVVEGAPGAGPGRSVMLVSRGEGDVQLVAAKRPGGACASGVGGAAGAGSAAPPPPASNTLYPLRPPLPLVGVRPLMLEAAYMAQSGDIRCVAWAIRAKAAPFSACCEVYAITLAHNLGSSGAGQQQQQQDEAGTPQQLHISVASVQLLRRTKLPPHVVRPYPAHDAVVVGYDPDQVGLPDEDDDLPHHHNNNNNNSNNNQHQHSNDQQPAQQQQQQQQQQPDQQPAGAAQPSSSGGGAAAGQDGQDRPNAAVAGDTGDMGEEGNEGDDDDGDDMDPQTLAQAAARLAAYTSEERVGPQQLPHQEWTDMYKESGPDGLGAMGSEPALELALWRLGGAPASLLASPGGGTERQPAAPSWRLTCGAHRLLASEDCGPAGPLLLGLTDDVDLALVQISWQGGAEEPQACHCNSVPALAYVVAGKTQKRHLLLCAPGAPLAAVLVEGHKYVYAYRSTSAGQQYGEQYMVDLELSTAVGEAVLGARLLPSAAQRPSGSNGDGNGQDARPPRLLVLTQRRLVVLSLAWGLRR